MLSTAAKGPLRHEPTAKSYGRQFAGRDRFQLAQPVEQRLGRDPRVTGIEITHIAGVPDPSRVCTSYVERNNLTMRHHNRRLVRACLKSIKQRVA